MRYGYKGCYPRGYENRDMLGLVEHQDCKIQLGKNAKNIQLDIEQGTVLELYKKRRAEAITSLLHEKVKLMKSDQSWLSLEADGFVLGKLNFSFD
ncbi:hypothetical protein L195_g026123 [Trifolium pratense]|uniref:Uncharacterized protein n=1 Tax=Trifolium pratense TaxID=57577 RepID=A0A2K3NIF4_TRIPR|nr:hypothetical protein L195_g026123 [Trifolium pratense]